jgi:hypothetical protein
MSSMTMPFMFVFRESTPELYRTMSIEQRRDALRDWNAWCEDLATSGRLKQGSPLFPESRVVSANPSGRVVDGPFAEAKELIGGYVIIETVDLDEATGIAERCPNLKFGMTVEIRAVAEACHLARSLGLRTMLEAVAI